MSTLTQLLCNRFGGIRERNASFSSDLITAQDMQNVELYYTGENTGIGIRTVKGNVSVNNELLNTSRIIKNFESVQQQKKYFFIYAENDDKGCLYNFNRELNQLEILKDNLTVTGKANGFDVTQGWNDLFFFTNGQDLLTVQMDVTDEDDVTKINKIEIMSLKDRDNREIKGINVALFNNRLWISKGNIIW